VIHVERVAQAMDEAASAAGWTAYPAAEHEPDDGRPEREVATVRFWFEPPLRVREERAGDHRWLVVQDGASWWCTFEDGTVHVGEDDSGDLQARAGGDVLPLLDPAPLLGFLQLEPTGRAKVAGREALLAVGVPRAGASVHTLDEVVPGADRYDLAVDAELGVVLRLEARREGQLLYRSEIRRARFDEPLPDHVFQYDPPDGATIVHADDAAEPSAGREEIAAMPFFAWAPRHRPGWTVRIDVVPAIADEPAALILTVRGPAGEGVVIREWESADGVEPWSDAATHDRWEPVEGNELDLRVCRPGEDWQPLRVRVERAGTAIELVSYTEDADELVALAESLELVA
jgi:hypothetical protein